MTPMTIVLTLFYCARLPPICASANAKSQIMLDYGYAFQPRALNCARAFSATEKS
jgi:hypothetical protein